MSEMETQLEECGVCHALHPYNELACFDDTLICPDCLEDSTLICGRCGERIWADDDHGNEDSGHLCQSCYDRYYNTCEDCHRIICEEDAYYEDDDTVLCYDCHRRHRSRYSINDYSYMPDPIFYGSDMLYMGVEIELDEGGESDNQARKLLEIANGETERIYCKHDGSLNDGFEVVSHPMTLAYHMEKMPWQAVLEKAKQLDYRSHQAKTCGLHIHVNRTAFGDNICEQEEVIARILYFFEKHWEELLKFSRRTHRQMEQWANRYGYPCNPSHFRDKFRAALEAIPGVRLLTPHCCRHTYVSQMQAMGVDLATIQSIVGHADLDMTRHYLHVQEPVRQAAAERFSEIFGAESE